MTFFIPSTIDFDFAETHFAPAFQPYKRDKLAYLLHKIATLSSTNKNTLVVDGFVSLYSPALQNIVANYTQYLDYAAQIGWIEKNNSYLVGKYSKSYRFVIADSTSLTEYIPTDFSLIMLHKCLFFSSAIVC